MLSCILFVYILMTIPFEWDFFQNLFRAYPQIRYEVSEVFKQALRPIVEPIALVVGNHST